jgi:hypothetical protein
VGWLLEHRAVQAMAVPLRKGCTWPRRSTEHIQRCTCSRACVQDAHRLRLHTCLPTCACAYTHTHTRTHARAHTCALTTHPHLLGSVRLTGQRSAGTQFHGASLLAISCGSAAFSATSILAMTARSKSCWTSDGHWRPWRRSINPRSHQSHGLRPREPCDTANPMARGHACRVPTTHVRLHPAAAVQTTQIQGCHAACLAQVCTMHPACCVDSYISCWYESLSVKHLSVHVHIICVNCDQSVIKCVCLIMVCQAWGNGLVPAEEVGRWQHGCHGQASTPLAGIDSRVTPPCA